MLFIVPRIQTDSKKLIYFGANFETIATLFPGYFILPTAHADLQI